MLSMHWELMDIPTVLTTPSFIRRDGININLLGGLMESVKIKKAKKRKTFDALEEDLDDNFMHPSSPYLRYNQIQINLIILSIPTSFESRLGTVQELPNENPEERSKREKRMKRFEGAQQERDKLKKKNAIISRKAQKIFLARGQEGNPDVIDWDEYTIIGTCQTLEKRYLRLTSVHS